MQKVTYFDKIYYKSYLRKKTVGLSDINEKYEIFNKKINQPHDKTIRSVLDKKDEVINLIDKALKFYEKGIKLKSVDIEKYNRKFITKEFQNSEADIVYKIKDKNIFFLIEHQSKIDYTMPYRILKYSIEIIDSAIDLKQMRKKDYEYPCVYPIVIYTGTTKWKVKRHFEQKQAYLYPTDETEFTKYTLIDINEISEQILIKDNSLLSKILLIERTKNKEETFQAIEKVMKTNLKEQDKQFLSNVIRFVLRNKLEENQVNKLLEKLNNKGELNMRWMDRIANAFDEKYEEGIKNGIAQGMIETAKKLIQRNMEINEIEEITGLSKEEIEKLVKSNA